MSLILDALRKADAERERGSVPGLRSQPVVPSSDGVATEKTTGRVGWPAIAIGIGVGLALAAIWMFVSRAPDPRAAASQSAVMPVPMAPTAAPSPAPIATPSELPPATTAMPPRDAASAGAASAGASGPIAEPAPWTRPGDGASAAASPPARGRGGATSDLPVYPYDLLPSQVRAALPPLTVSGSIYSSDPRGRSLIVNGRLMREGNAVTPELTIEEIRQKSAIFAFRAYRFEVPF